MNKLIKAKKKEYLNFKKAFTKEERLFIKQYPRLYPMCSLRGITRLETKRAFKKVSNACSKLNISKVEMELTFRRCLSRR